MGKPESEIEDYLCAQCENLGFLCMKFVSPANNGVPDRLIIGHGYTFFIETKRPGGKPRPLQKITIQSMQEHGAFVYVASTKDEVDNILYGFLNHGSYEPPGKKTEKQPIEYIGTKKPIIHKSNKKGQTHG